VRAPHDGLRQAIVLVVADRDGEGLAVSAEVAAQVCADLGRLEEAEALAVIPVQQADATDAGAGTTGVGNSI